MARNLRNNEQENGGFFIFQDIITTVIGCMLMIILFLIFSSRSEVLSGNTGSPEVVAALRSKLAEIERLENQVLSTIGSDQAGEPAGGRPVSPEALKIMEARVAALQTRLAQIDRTAATLNARGPSPLERAAADSAAVEQKLKAELAPLRTRLATDRESQKNAEQQIKDLEAAIIQALKDNQKIWVLPDATRSTKKPVFGIVSGDKIRWALYNKKASVPESSTRQAAIGVAHALRDYPPKDYYVVLYFRPSGAAYFKAITGAIKEKQFELGYDSIEETTPLSFESVEANR